ncbi:MAG TPA: bacteriohopanetetrol glucosamine biosynthesis glycosyltransferase HpnI [Bryobacteraceae bacterium]|nr:bacteriohopanetetrol glucosamine biosynthesis glycosyltransferase HpnI [Bryobacteraceae bacterium]
MLGWLLLALVAGSLVYCLLVIVAARRYLAVWPSPMPGPLPPLSVLKPLAGLDLGLESNLRTFFTQDYPSYELLFAVRTQDDPAVPVVRRLQAEYPHVPSRLLLVGEPPYPNAKVWSLAHMTEAARHDILVMSDSDIRVDPQFLQVIAAEFQDAKLGVSTCPYRAVPGPSLWSQLEALGMNTEFLSGVVVARMLEGMRFALGPTATARRQALNDIGGWDKLKDYLAEDFVLGNAAAAQGWGVILSSYVVEHHIGSQAFGANARHRIRWFRSTRRSRPAGYVGQLFTNPVPLALLMWGVRPDWWPVIALTAAVRAFAAYATAGWILHDPLTARRWYLLPLQDILSFVFWIAGFFGKTILWRGRRYLLMKDGTFRLIEA